MQATRAFIIWEPYKLVLTSALPVTPATTGASLPSLASGVYARRSAGPAQRHTATHASTETAATGLHQARVLFIASALRTNQYLEYALPCPASANPQPVHGHSLAGGEGSPRVLILGGGFGGLYTAVRLSSLFWPKGRKPQARAALVCCPHHMSTGTPSDSSLPLPGARLLLD